MSQGESIIAILLAVIAYFLYIIAKQLSYLTGRRIKFRIGFPKFPSTRLRTKSEEPRKLPN